MQQADTIHIDTAALPFYQLSEPYEQPVVDEVNVGIPLDSIFRPCDAADTVYRPTLFTGHKLAPQHSGLQQRTPAAMPAWIFIVIVGLCAMLCIYYRLHKLKLSEMLKSTVDGSSPDRLMRGSVQGVAYLPTPFMLSASLGMAIWITAMQSTGPLGYFLLMLALTAAYMLRNGALVALAAVFDQQQAMDNYIISNYVYHLLLATLATPMLFVLAYIPGASTAALIAIGGLTALEFIMRFLNGAKLFLTKTKNFSFFLFYYLCTVEMIPLLVALKWIISQ